MKTDTLLLSCLLAFPILGNAAIMLNQGESALLTFNLQDVSFVSGVSPENTRVGVHFQDLAPAESFSLKVYEDGTLSSQLFSAVYSGGDGNTFYDFSPAIADLDGIVQIAMLDGSASLDEFFVAITLSNGRFYSKKYPEPTAASIPEPTAYGLIFGLFGITMSVGSRRRSTRSA